MSDLSSRRAGKAVDRRRKRQNAAGGRRRPVQCGKAFHLYLGLGEPGLYRHAQADFISPPAQRLMDFAVKTIQREIGYEASTSSPAARRRESLRRLDFRPPFPADAICPQEAQGFWTQRPDRGRHARRRPHAAGRRPRDRRTHKVNFFGVREAGQICDHAFVFFFYDIFPQARAELRKDNIELHQLTTWWDVLKSRAGRLSSGRDPRRGGKIPAQARRMVGGPRRRQRIRQEGVSAMGRRLAFVGAVALFSSRRPAQSDDRFCSGVGFADTPDLVIGRIKPDAGKMYFRKNGDRKNACPSAAPHCQGKAFLVPGDLVVLGDKRGDPSASITTMAMEAAAAGCHRRRSSPRRLTAILRHGSAPGSGSRPISRSNRGRTD